MWHLLAKLGRKEVTWTNEAWEELRRTLVWHVLPRVDPATRNTLRTLIGDASPDRPWSCAGADCVIKLRSIGSHMPMPKDALMSDAVFEDGEHADLGASGADRWWNCAGNLNLVRQLKESNTIAPVSSVYAREGTAAHKLGHMCLLNGQDAIEYIGRTIDEFDIDDEMATAVQVYLDKCRSYINADVECFTEKRFNLKVLKPPGPMFGTSDFGVIDRKNKKLIIVDYKHGVGITVNVENNPQLKYYALGVLCALPRDVVIETIETVIVQPRGMGNPIKTCTYRAGHIFEWHFELLERAKATIDPNAPRTAGPWCKFCPAAGRCDAQAEAAYAVAQQVFQAEDPVTGTIMPIAVPEMRLFTPQQLGNIRAQFDVLKSFMSAVDDTIKALIGSGTEVPGWKLASGEGNRQWIEEAQLGKTLAKQLGLTKDEIYETKPISPAQAEKLAITKMRALGMLVKDAKPMAQAELKKLTVRPLTAPSLVPVTSDRPALPDASDVFEAEDQPALP